MSPEMPPAAASRESDCARRRFCVWAIPSVRRSWRRRMHSWQSAPGRRARDDSSSANGAARRPGSRLTLRAPPAPSRSARERLRAVPGSGSVQALSRLGQRCCFTSVSGTGGSRRRAVSRSAGRMQRSPREPQQRCSSSIWEATPPPALTLARSQERQRRGRACRTRADRANGKRFRSAARRG